MPAWPAVTISAYTINRKHFNCVVVYISTVHRGDLKTPGGRSSLAQ